MAVVRDMTLVHMDMGDVDDYFMEQSTVFLSTEDNESVNGSMKNTTNPVRLTKNQKKNLKR